MSLPVTTSLADCADWSTTVAPYLPQLYALPYQVYSSLTDPEALKQIYIATNPVISGLAFALALFPVFFTLSEVNRNYSQVDRFWSILPTVFIAHFATWARFHGLPTQRVDNVLAFGVVWTIRLTYNYWRKGGYEIGSEDYRWEMIKKEYGAALFFLLNLFFIASLQIVLLFAIATPTYVLLLASRLEPDMSLSDVLFARALIALVVFGYFADGQMWAYQQGKKQYQRTAKVPPGYTRAQMDRGFLTAGLFRYSRHPNFAAEQSLWVLLYAWGCYGSGTWWNWTVGGAIGYLLVFQGSTPLTENISKGKYPEYGLYQERVGKFLPKLGGKGWDEAEMELLGRQYAERVKQREAATQKKK